MGQASQFHIYLRCLHVKFREVPLTALPLISAGIQPAPCPPYCWFVSTLFSPHSGLPPLNEGDQKCIAKLLLITNFPPHSRNIVSRRLPLLSRLVKLLNFSKNMLSQELPFSLDHFHQRRRGIINSNRILTVCLCVHLKEAISHSDVWETLSLQPVKTENMVKRVVNSLDIVEVVAVAML